MSALTWVIAKGSTMPAPAVAATFAAAGVVASGLLLWASRRTSRRIDCAQHETRRQLATVAGEVNAIQEKADCKSLVNQLWVSDRDTTRTLFSLPRGT